LGLVDKLFKIVQYARVAMTSAITGHFYMFGAVRVVVAKFEIASMRMYGTYRTYSSSLFCQLAAGTV
jgi:hypothetical protein